MAYIPILGRLSLHDYLYLLLTLVFSVVEFFLRVCISPILYFFPSYNQQRERKTEQHRSFEQLIEDWNVKFEEHVVETADGYLLGLHRIYVDTHHNKPVVLLWHGFMMCSEVFACSITPERNLAHILAHAGYDVWLGNTRGNKYSYKHIERLTTQKRFWNFSIDHLARYDVPNTVDYILREANKVSVSYVGFSQGTAQMFAALALNTELNDKINLFVALAPATRPPGLDTDAVGAVLRASPDLIYLFVGRDRALAFSVFWRDSLPRSIYVKLLDESMRFLFGWNLQGMEQSQKESCYAHLYSYTSVKMVVHWFQIIRSGRFQSYDDATTTSRDHVVYAFPTHRIRTPVMILHGGSDALTNIQCLLDDIPTPVECHEIEGYEHLDFLWATTAPRRVYPYVIQALDKYKSA